MSLRRASARPQAPWQPARRPVWQVRAPLPLCPRGGTFSGGRYNRASTGRVPLLSSITGDMYGKPPLPRPVVEVHEHYLLPCAEAEPAFGNRHRDAGLQERRADMGKPVAVAPAGVVPVRDINRG